MSMISNEDIQNFENDGFLIKKNFFKIYVTDVLYESEKQ